MLACVCQPAETALLFKGGPPVAMGPLGTNIKKHQGSTDSISVQLMSKTAQYSNGDINGMSLTSSPTLFKSKTNLLNLRKIERKAKSTKILVNPVCSDSVESSDESNRSKKITSKWNGKKKRLKPENIISCYKSEDTDEFNYDTINVRRDSAHEEKKTIGCFELKNTEEKSTMQDHKNGKDNCRNENSSNWRIMESDKPDLINHSSKNSREYVIKVKVIEDEIDPKRDQLSEDKTDSVNCISKIHEVRQVIFNTFFGLEDASSCVPSV